MTKKKTKKGTDISKQSYVSKPSERKLARAYKKAKDPEVSQQISKIYEAKEKAYKKQRTQILTGEKPSKIKATLQSAYKKFMEKKKLKKPKVKLPSYSGKKFVSSLASNRNEMIRDVENPYANPEQDNRSLFFKESFKEERRKAFGGFI